MSRRLGPLAGTYPRMLLDAVAAAPNGVLSYAKALLVVPSDYRSARRFESAALKPLESRWMMAALYGEVIRLLPNGVAFVRQCREDANPAARRHASQVVQPRTVPHFKPMSAASFSKMMAGGPQRSGMDDFRDCPSLMAGKRVLPTGEIVE